MPKKIKVKLLFIQFLTLIPFLIFLFYLLDVWYSNERQTTLIEKIFYAKMASDQIENSFIKGKAVAEVLADDAYLFQIIEKDKTTTAKTILKNIKSKFQGVDDIYIADAFGKIIVSTLDLSYLQENISLYESPYFQEALKTNKTSQSFFSTDPFTNKKTIAVATPVVRNDQTIAVVVSTIDVEQIKEIFSVSANNEFKQKNFFILLDPDGKIVFITNYKNLSENEKFFLANSKYVNTNKEVVLIDNEQFPYFEKKVMGAAIAVNDAGWIVFSLSPTTEIFSPILTAQNFILLIIISSFFVSLTISSLIIRKIRIIY